MVGQDRALEQLFRVLSMPTTAPIVVLLCGASASRLFNIVLTDTIQALVATERVCLLVNVSTASRRVICTDISCNSRIAPRCANAHRKYDNLAIYS